MRKNNRENSMKYFGVFEFEMFDAENVVICNRLISLSLISASFHKCVIILSSFIYNLVFEKIMIKN